MPLINRLGNANVTRLAQMQRTIRYTSQRQDKSATQVRTQNRARPQRDSVEISMAARKRQQLQAQFQTQPQPANPRGAQAGQSQTFIEPIRNINKPPQPPSPPSGNSGVRG